jgi:hypothetical protein
MGAHPEMPSVTTFRPSGEGRNPVFSTSSGCRITSGMTEENHFQMEINSLFRFDCHKRFGPPS